MNTESYLLFHKNIPTAAICIQKSTGNIYSTDIINKEHAPFGCYDEKAFSAWWERRAIPKHQQNTISLLEGKTNLEYMLQNLGLSLVDSYWVCPISKSFTWEDVNLYTHDFAEKDFHFSDIENASPFKPSATTQGELQKRWVLKNGERFLVKGNYGNMFRQSLNEVFASYVHSLQGVDHTNYETIQLPTTMGTGIGCISKNFTNENMEFIPAYDVTFFDKQPNNMSVLEHYISICTQLGISKQTMENHIDYMILSDFLLTNVDRHLLNLGILRNPDTLEFVKPAPYFDTGNSMFYNMNYIPNLVHEINTTSFYKTEIKMMEHVKNPLALDMNKIPDATELSKFYSSDPYSIVYLENMKRGYEQKIVMLEAFQKGYSLNPRSNNFYQNQMQETELSDDYNDFT